MYTLVISPGGGGGVSAREELRAPVQRLALSSEKQAGVWNSLLLEQSKFSIIDVATV